MLQKYIFLLTPPNFLHYFNVKGLYFVNHQYSVPTIYQWVSCACIFEKSFDFLFFIFRRHAQGAQHPCHLHNGEHSHMAVNHQYSVPTIYQRVSRTSIFE